MHNCELPYFLERVPDFIFTIPAKRRGAYNQKEGALLRGEFIILLY